MLLLLLLLLEGEALEGEAACARLPGRITEWALLGDKRISPPPPPAPPP